MKGKIKLTHGEDYYIKVLLKETKISEVMTPSPVTIHVGESFSEVPKYFREHRIRHLPVVSTENKLLGLITQRDLFRIHAPKKLLDGEWMYDEEDLKSIILEHVMVREPFCLHEDESMGKAVVTIVEKKYGCIPVVDSESKVCGIVTQMDILKVAAQIFLE